MDKIFKLLANQTFNIEPNWGLGVLNEILLNKELGANANDSFAMQKEQSQKSTYYPISSNPNSKGSIALVEMNGVMRDTDGLCSYGMTSLDAKLRSLYADNDVKGIILSVNSGGGYSTAGDILYNAIADKNKPLVVHSIYMCSAALKGTLKADEIIAASESTIIGSIGTMMSMPKWYIEDAKENDVELYSRESPNKNGPWRALKEGNFEPYIDLLTNDDLAFMKLVKANRPLKGNETYVKETLSGGVFLGTEAKKRGLVDGIGSLNYAIKRVKAHISYK